MRRVAVAVIVLAIAAIAGCGKDGGKPEQPPPPDTTTTDPMTISPDSTLEVR